ncbi:MAG: hypothetical protein ACRDHF_14910 [Tepidiformaceae bacterium]
MTSTSSGCDIPPEPVEYTILVRGSLDEALQESYPDVMLLQVEGDTLLTGVAPHREHLFELLQHLNTSGVELLSASLSPPPHPGL